jgi:hypothetical protein
MKRWVGVALLVFVGTAGWRIGDSLSPDALSMAVGVLFGVMAGVPTALLVMAGSRRRNRDECSDESRSRQQQASSMPTHGYEQMYNWPAPYAQQPPIIVVAGPQGMGGTQQSAQTNMGWLPQETPVRHFTVVGEHEALAEDW